MDRDITGRQPHFRPQNHRSNPYRILMWLGLIVGGVWLFLQVQSGGVKPLFLPTPTPTRTAQSYTLEGESLFDAGDLTEAIKAYQEATRVDPQNAQLWADLARIQNYSSSLLSNDTDRFQRLKDALDSIDQAAALQPDNADVLAIRALVLDWYASSFLLTDDERQSSLNEAEREAARAFNLDPENAQALAFYAEILVDQQKWSQAQQYVEQAVLLDPGSMDVHRVYGYVLESLGQYRQAIEEYQKAADITPNLTFLYIFIGRNFRTLEVHNRALEFFEKAANINNQLGINDPVPYIEIAKTYSRDGEFFIAAINAQKALQYDPTNANTYGQLGIIYTKARNYEGARPALKCAVVGCSADENETAKEILDQRVAVQGLPLTSGTVAFYYLQYGSVLAALSRPNQNYCPDALEVLEEVRAAYPDDSLFNDIINENEAICKLVGNTQNP
jgi:tetratricopeptide (TPR) repeat protein